MVRLHLSALARRPIGQGSTLIRCLPGFKSLRADQAAVVEWTRCHPPKVAVEVRSLPAAPPAFDLIPPNATSLGGGELVILRDWLTTTEFFKALMVITAALARGKGGDTVQFCVGARCRWRRSEACPVSRWSGFDSLHRLLTLLAQRTE